MCIENAKLDDLCDSGYTERGAQTLTSKFNKTACPSSFLASQNYPQTTLNSIPFQPHCNFPT